MHFDDGQGEVCVAKTSTFNAKLTNFLLQTLQCEKAVHGLSLTFCRFVISFFFHFKVSP